MPYESQPGSGSPPLDLHRRRDLQAHILECYEIIKEYEDKHRVSDDPKERRRFEREIAEQKTLLASFEKELAELEDVSRAGSAHLFICYKRGADPDQRLAHLIGESLIAEGHSVFLDTTLRTGDEWLDEIDEQIKKSDFLVVLLSQASADSEMVRAEVRRAFNYRKTEHKPRTLPVRVAYEDMLPYGIEALVGEIQYVAWQSADDDERVVREILAAIGGQPSLSQPVEALSAPSAKAVSEDGRPVSGDGKTPPRPSPEFDPRVLKGLSVPGGVVRLRDRFYVERAADARLKEHITGQGTTVTIRAPRQTGKTSLLMRGVQYAREQGAPAAVLDFQLCGSEQLASFDVFLQEFAGLICDELELDVETSVLAGVGRPRKLLSFMEKKVLPAFGGPVVLAMDEADCLLDTDFYRDFFGMLRSWHNRRAFHELWLKLNMVLVISTEPYLLIDDIHQSPFNVGLDLPLDDFDQAQVRDLNLRHGSPVSEDDLLHLLAMLGGHPYLTRRALYVMLSERIGWPELVHRAPSDHGPFGDHLRRQYWDIRDRPALRKAMQEVIRTNHCADEMALYRLHRAGLVKGSGTQHVCRCDLYRLYFEGKLF
jgi:hypothetical protein